jgi:hypothetical protein
MQVKKVEGQQIIILVKYIRKQQGRKSKRPAAA